MIKYGTLPMTDKQFRAVLTQHTQELSAMTTHDPNEQAILDIRASINRRRRIRDTVRHGIAWTLVAAAVTTVALFTLVGCASGPIIPSCPSDRCIGPYDLTLSSHREALDAE